MTSENEWIKWSRGSVLFFLPKVQHTGDMSKERKVGPMKETEKNQYYKTASTLEWILTSASSGVAANKHQGLLTAEALVNLSFL